MLHKHKVQKNTWSYIRNTRTLTNKKKYTNSYDKHEIGELIMEKQHLLGKKKFFSIMSKYGSKRIN